MLHLVALAKFIAQNWDLYGEKEKNELHSLASMVILKFKAENLYFDDLNLTSPRSISVFRRITLSSTKYFG